MPIATEKDLPRRDMEMIANSGAVCGTCGAVLTVAWGGELGWILRCGRSLEHNTMRRLSAKSSKELEGEKVYRRMKMQGTELTTISPEKMLAERMPAAMFPQSMSMEQRLFIAKIAVSYGLDPMMNELTVYQGQPFVSLAARLRKAQETEQLDGVDMRPATTEEKTGRGLEAGDYLFMAEVWRKGSSRPFMGWGTVKKAEIDRAVGNARSNNRDPFFLPLVKDPASMAEKRAIAKGLKLAFHLPLPSVEDIGGEDPLMPDSSPVPPAVPVSRANTHPQSIPSNTPPACSVIIDQSPAEGMVQPSENPERAATRPSAKPTRDPASIKILADCWKACHEDFGLQPKDCLRELGASNQADIVTTPSECYLVLKKLREDQGRGGGG
ncbi:hypothetical protein [Dehalogenimonas etheniformans]|uniref:Uncharacterized protein n=1 Tax=Dehalogenimonas etheniformans TaxID=1536648 RepID=A0A2P5P501_9CHLR|nr:hypothetical protein [Dehalogenimonas etheniformans]PPD57366.1 hypothetical protein JP09_010020 [Dehalogenimonas etheniformans]QNT75216.1 hypothetical protein HX448_00165 [Dehalogenimonas etheniformans]